jgi:HAE1 family hydrophobic/amphiphilic exporter-1
LIEAGQTRLRPILMTPVSMVVGMLPIALSSDAGAEWKSGLAWVLVGGLVSSLLLTLVLVPVMYTKVDEWRVKFHAFIRRLVSGRPRAKHSETVSGEPIVIVDRSSN